jgi:UDP:flavonoid glycosyltransferase YjiC (YdhE family)
MSCNPLEMTGPDVPPAYSGLPCDDRREWGSFRAEYDRTHRAMWTAFNAWVVEQGAAPLPELEFIHASADANLYVFPEEADYTALRPLDPTWHRMDSSVRGTDQQYVVPADVADRPEGSALVYLSLGSLGSADVDLMRRLVDVLGRTPHRFIVSKGSQHADYELADNMVGAEFLPQTTLIPQVDAVITHGGNNTVTEALHFGRPMVLLPLFWDQYDNAQRMDELGFGVRLQTYTFSDDDMTRALGVVLSKEKRAELAAIGELVRARDGLVHGADVIEQVARSYADSRGGASA